MIEPPSQHGIVEPGAEVVEREHVACQRCVLDLLARIEVLVLVQIVQAPCHAERIVIRRLLRLKAPAHGAQQSPGAARMIGLEVVVREPAVRMRYGPFRMQDIEQLVPRVDHHAAVICERTACLLGELLARSTVNVANFLVSCKYLGESRASLMLAFQTNTSFVCAGRTEA